MNMKRIDYRVMRMLHAAGCRDIDIARRMHCNPSTVFKWRKRNGFSKNSGKLVRMVETPDEFDARMVLKIVLSVSAGGEGMRESVKMALMDVRRHERAISKSTTPS